VQGSRYANSTATFALRAGVKLKAVAETLKCAVLAVNQVRATGFASGTDSATGTQLNTAALGHAWASCVSTRLHLRVEGRHAGDASARGLRRVATVTLSSHLPTHAVSFAIDHRGIVDVDHDDALGQV
jgi:hypothetical protein